LAELSFGLNNVCARPDFPLRFVLVEKRAASESSRWLPEIDADILRGERRR